MELEPNMQIKVGVAFFAAFGASEVSGCSPVTKLVFSNWCSKDITLKDWNFNIAAGQTADITWGRPASNRIGWRYTDGSTNQHDFIELNSYWSGPGTPMCGHPSYSTYNGYNMASKYEALNPNTGNYACKDPGAEVNYNTWNCPSGAGNGYNCRGDPNCASPYSNYIKSHSLCINPDGSKTARFKETPNYSNFWCSEKYGFNSLVATMTDCVDHGIPIMFVITACDVDRSSHDIALGNATFELNSTSSIVV